MFDSLAVKEMWNSFYSIYNKLLDKYIPGVVISAKKVLPLWMKFVKTRLKLKHKAWIKYKRSLLFSEYSIYVQIRNDCTAAVRRAKYDFENNLVNGIKVNPKRFWKYVASQAKVKHTVGGLLKSDGSLTVDDNDTANTLNKFFGSVFTQENALDVLSFGAWHLGSSLSTI